MRTCPHCHSLVPFPLDACPARREVCPLLLGAEAPGDDHVAAPAEARDEDPSEAPTHPGVLLADPLLADPLLADPLRTARIDQAEIRAALAGGGLDRLHEPPPPPPAAPQSPPPAPRGARESPPPSPRGARESPPPAPRGAREPPPPAPSITRPTPIEPALRSRPAQHDRPALLARRLGHWSVLPLFPIGFAAVAVALVALARGRSMPSSAGTTQAWSGLLTGLLFGSTWLALTVWLLLRALR
jgi:hypothetical protein